MNSKLTIVIRDLSNGVTIFYVSRTFTLQPLILPPARRKIIDRINYDISLTSLMKERDHRSVNNSMLIGLESRVTQAFACLFWTQEKVNHPIYNTRIKFV